MQLISDPLDYPLLRQRLERGARAALLLRHSERPPIDPADREFGRDLALTPGGERLARDAGTRLAGLRDVRFLASPMTRCRLTAHFIAQGMGLPDAAIEDADPLGVRGFYYEDPYAVQDLMRQQGYMAYMLAYLNAGHAPHSRPLGDATAQMADWLRAQATARLNLFVSHDIFIAAFLTGLRLRTYSASDWVGFLHGAALLQDADGGWTCQPCVPDLAHAGPHPHFIQ